MVKGPARRHRGGRAGAGVAVDRVEFAADGVFARLDAWLSRNAAGHGFFRPYSTWRGGVQPEPWHLSHAAVAGVALHAFSVEVLRAALADVNLDARGVVEPMLPDIFERYVRNVDVPPAGTTTSPTRPA